MANGFPEQSGPLRKADLDPDPFKQFQNWFTEALNHEPHSPEAMSVATASLSGIPSVRTMFLRGFNKQGFTFYTNFESRKGIELAENSHAALLFFWGALRRQVRLEGTVKKVVARRADTYFKRRPRQSQLGAWASAQSKVIPNREALENSLRDLEARYQDQDIPRPPHWGGYRLIPTSIEFWQNQPNRLHDRLRYTLTENGGWLIERLAP